MGRFAFPHHRILQARCQWGYDNAQMDDKKLKEAFAEIGRRGGKARAEALSAKQRKAIATKASKAAAVARTRKAKEKAKAKSKS